MDGDNPEARTRTTRSRQAWALVTYTLGVEVSNNGRVPYLFKDGTEDLRC